MVAEINTSFIIENDKAFKAGIDRLAKTTDDFRVPFNLIRADFYRSNRKLFTLQSKGLYEDLSTKPFLAFWQNKNGFASYYAGGYKEYKQVNYGFIYPILVGRTRRLMRSLLSSNADGAVNFVGRKILELGTDIEYAKYHQSDRPRTKIPQRKIVFIDGGPAEKASDASIAGRKERWLNIMNTYITDLIQDFEK